MHPVVNHLTLSRPLNDDVFERVHLEVGNPWIGANVRPSVATADRKVGVVAAHARVGE